jgi:hypothetical protein
MSRSLPNRFLILLVMLVLSPLTAGAEADCSKELAIFDERIASTKGSDLNVQLALQYRSTLEQMCSLLDDAAKQAMLDGLDELLPTKSKDELRAERRARSAEQKALRKARKRAKAQAEQNQPIVSAVLRAPPTAEPLAARFMDRPEDMVRLWIWDWDRSGDKLRVLYTTLPALQQLGRPDWQQYVYVVEMSAEGVARQQLVTSKQAQDHAALALRRGHDEILLQRQPEHRGEPSTLERWSISGKRRLSSVATPSPAWVDGSRWDWQPFRLATRDGNLLFSATKRSRDGTSTIAWFEASPGGKVLGRGSVSSSAEKIGSTAWFHTDNGGGGLISHVQTTGDTGIRSAISTPITREVAGRELRAYVGFEKRLLVVSDDGTSVWESPAIESTLMWSGDMALPKGLEFGEMMRQQKEQMELMESVSNELDANRNTNYLNVGPHRVEMIKPIADGVGILSTVSANRKLRPQIHGPYFLELDDSRVRKATYLDSLAEKLEVKFTTFAVSQRNDLFLYGAPAGRESNAYVVVLDANRKPKAYGRAAPHWDVVRGMIADDSGVWLFGHGDPDGKLVRLWVERIAFP